ncbi:hypothetical protein HYX14_05000 [Candidatus Woesearchaeota archaeon]|nr:hypothetical protein [Candidatus Woesearchaeota archaeon]
MNQIKANGPSEYTTDTTVSGFYRRPIVFLPSFSDVYLDYGVVRWCGQNNAEILKIARKLKTEGYYVRVGLYEETTDSLDAILKSEGTNKFRNCTWEMYEICSEEEIPFFYISHYPQGGFGRSWSPRDDFSVHQNSLYFHSGPFKGRSFVLDAAYKPGTSEPLKQKILEQLRTDGPWFLPNFFVQFLNHGEDYLAGKSIYSSPWGEGGCWVDFGQFILASTKLQERLGLKTNDFEWDGTPVYFVSPIGQERTVRYRGSNPLLKGFSWAEDLNDTLGHIDYHVGGLNLSANETMAVVDPAFYHANREIFKTIEKRYGITLVKIPKEETNACPANFLVLPDHRILMTEDASKTRESMERIINSSILTVKARALLDEGFGPRCATNILL